MCLGAQGYCLGAGGGDSPPACAGVTSLILLERLLIYAEELGPARQALFFICNIAVKFVYKGFGTAADSFSPSPLPPNQLQFSLPFGSRCKTD